MPTRLLLEGHDIEELLERIRAEHGPEARIVQADKVRTGGVAGFFAKEHYEVEIEIDDRSDAVTSWPASADLPAFDNPFLALAQRADEEEIAFGSALQSTSAPRSPAGIWGAPLTSSNDVTADTVASDTTAADTTASETEPDDVSMEESAERFASMLARLAAASQDVPSAEDVDFPVAPAAFVPYVRDKATAAEDVAEPVDEPVDEPEQPSMSTRSLPAVSGPYVDTANEPVSAGSVSGQSVHDTVAARRPATAAPEASRRTPSAPHASSPAVPQASETLHALGLPVDLVGSPPASSAPTPGVEAVAALADAIGALPPPPRPPGNPGDVLVVVGEAAPAHEAARGLARALGQDPKTVSVISQARKTNAGRKPREQDGVVTAHQEVRRLRATEAPAVLVVDAPMGYKGADRAREILDVCRPAAVWAVVDATRKSADLAEQMRRLGRVDALIVHSAWASTDPGTVLDLGIPVAMLDGRRATRSAWTALLSARLFGEEEE